ncbi:hypothetical protein Nmel_003191 [Mimus melanotis]
MKKPNVSEDFQASVAVMATVSQLLDANKTKLLHNNLVNATTSLTKAMEEFSFTDTVLGKFQSTKLEIQENVPELIGDLSTEVQILFNILSNKSPQFDGDKNESSLATDGGVASSVEIAFSPKTMLLCECPLAKPPEFLDNMKTRSLATKWMLVSLCFSVLIFNIILVSGIENQTSRKCSSDTTRCYQQYLPYGAASTTLLTSDMDPPADSWCPAVAVLMYCFLLATFLWSALSSALLYLLLLRAMKLLPGHFLVSMSVIGWVALIFLFNILIFIRISISVIYKKINLIRNKKDSLMKNINTISIVVVLGLAWMIGYLMLISSEKTSLAFSFLFCVLNTTQGLQICILFTFRIPLFKKKVSKVYHCICIQKHKMFQNHSLKNIHRKLSDQPRYFQTIFPYLPSLTGTRNLQTLLTGTSNDGWMTLFQLQVAGNRSKAETMRSQEQDHVLAGQCPLDMANALQLSSPFHNCIGYQLAKSDFAIALPAFVYLKSQTSRTSQEVIYQDKMVICD